MLKTFTKRKICQANAFAASKKNLMLKEVGEDARGETFQSFLFQKKKFRSQQKMLLTSFCSLSVEDFF